MSEIDAGNDCGVRCPKQLACVRTISTAEVLIEKYDKETFAIDMAWKTSDKADAESPIIERLKQSTLIEVESLRRKLEAAQKELGRLVLAECDGPDIIIEKDTVIRWACVAEHPDQESETS